MTGKLFRDGKREIGVLGIRVRRSLSLLRKMRGWLAGMVVAGVK